jgi:enamine deaminase RidA (YjgF/YER057c/UK114 family)
MTREIINHPQYDVPVEGTFTQAVVARAGRDILFVSGVTSRGDDGTFVEGDIVKQTQQVLSKLKQIIENAGGSMDEVIKTTTFVRNADDISTVSKIRREYFGDPPPASSSVEVSRLFDARQLIEIEAVVSLPAQEA